MIDIALFAILLLGQTPALELCIDKVEYHQELPFAWMIYTVRNPSPRCPTIAW